MEPRKKRAIEIPPCPYGRSRYFSPSFQISWAPETLAICSSGELRRECLGSERSVSLRFSCSFIPRVPGKSPFFRFDLFWIDSPSPRFPRLNRLEM